MPREAIAEALCRLQHRGPDDGGLHQSEGVFVGVRRLAIIDLAGGHQPVCNEDGSVVAVLNGEIYNYVELMHALKAKGHGFKSACDTEVLVHLYEEHLEEMVKELRGMFAFAIWDARRQRLFLARDRFGKKPLYYMHPCASGGGLLFASELKALKPLVAAAGAHWQLRDQSIYDYLSLGAIPQPDTAYREVRMLPAASWMEFDGRQLRQEQYWRLAYEPKVNLSYPETLEQIRTLVREAVRIRLRSDVPLGIFLSGGVDSSVVTYEAARQIGETLQAFTVSTGHPEFDEAPTAKRTAQALGVKTTILPLKLSPLEELQFLVRHYDQPFADSSSIPTYAVSRLAARHLKVVLNGDGGDELFAGYRRYLAANRFEAFRWLPRPFFRFAARGLAGLSRRRRSRLGFAARFVRGMASDPGTRFLVWTTDLLFEEEKRRFWKRAAMRPTEELIAESLPAALPMLDVQRVADANFILGSTLLVKMDMATMAASLEARSPLLDSVLAEFTARLPASHLLRNGRPKAALRDAYRGRIPDEVVDGQKRGFEIPLVAWLENELRPVLWDTLGDKSARLRSYLADELVDGLLARRILADRNWGHLVYALLVLELWLRER